MPNQGEGNRTAAKQFNDAESRFVKSGQVDAAARAAVKAVDGPEGDTLRRAEEEAKRRGAVPSPSPAKS